METKMFIDPQRPGIIRWNDDPTAGILAGMRATEIVEAVNGYEHLRATLRYILAQAKAGHPGALAVIAANAESALGGLQDKVREMLRASEQEVT